MGRTSAGTALEVDSWLALPATVFESLNQRLGPSVPPFPSSREHVLRENCVDPDEMLATRATWW